MTRVKKTYKRISKSKKTKRQKQKAKSKKLMATTVTPGDTKARITEQKAKFQK